MSDINLAWMAGLFEGEGYIRKHKGRGIGINMTDLDILERFQAFAAVGTIRPKKVAEPHHKPAWEWAIYKNAEVYRLLELMLPYFGERRAFTALNRLDIIDCC